MNNSINNSNNSINNSKNSINNSTNGLTACRAPEVAKDTNVPSTDFISRQVAIDELDKGAWGVEWDKVLAKAMLENLPSAQPEIIRCRDCRWRKDQSGSTAWLPCRAIATPSDFYCGRAERKTDGCR